MYFIILDCQKVISILFKICSFDLVFTLIILLSLGI